MGRRSQPRKCKRRQRLADRRWRDLDRCPVSGKVCFPDTASAQRLLDEAAIARELVAGWFGDPSWSIRQEQRMYQCTDCQHWHVTSRA